MLAIKEKMFEGKMHLAIEMRKVGAPSELGVNIRINKREQFRKSNPTQYNCIHWIRTYLRKIDRARSKKKQTNGDMHSRRKNDKSFKSEVPLDLYFLRNLKLG